MDSDVFMARNMFGALNLECRTRLQAVIDEPNLDTWEDAHSLIIGADGWITLWQAVIAVDPTFPRTGPTTTLKGKKLTDWERVPDRSTIRQALAYATH